MRSQGGGGGNKTITATTRQLESLIRISQALAKMRLSRAINTDDVIEAIRLMRVATQTAATDPRTGTIDIDMITTGKTALSRDLLLHILEELRKLLDHRRGDRFSLSELRQLLITTTNSASNAAFSSRSGSVMSPDVFLTMSLNDLEEAVQELQAEGRVQYIESMQRVFVR